MSVVVLSCLILWHLSNDFNKSICKKWLSIRWQQNVRDHLVHDNIMTSISSRHNQLGHGPEKEDWQTDRAQRNTTGQMPSLMPLINREMHLKMPRESVGGCVRTVPSPTSHKAGWGRSKFSECSSVMLWVTDIMQYPINNAAEAQPARQLSPLAFPVLFSYTITPLQFGEEEQAVTCS